MAAFTGGKTPAPQKALSHNKCHNDSDAICSTAKKRDFTATQIAVKSRFLSHAPEKYSRTDECMPHAKACKLLPVTSFGYTIFGDVCQSIFLKNRNRIKSPAAFVKWMSAHPLGSSTEGIKNPSFGYDKRKNIRILKTAGIYTYTHSLYILVGKC